MSKFAVLVLYQLLLARGIVRATVTFNGGGDDGQMDDCRFYTNTEALVAPTSELGEDPATMLQDLAGLVVADQGIDYCNGDGGRGVVEFDFATGTTLLQYGYFETILRDEPPIDYSLAELQDATERLSASL